MVVVDYGRGGGGVGGNAFWVSKFFFFGWVLFDFGLLMVVDLHSCR